MSTESGSLECEFLKRRESCGGSGATRDLCKAELKSSPETGMSTESGSLECGRYTAGTEKGNRRVDASGEHVSETGRILDGHGFIP